MSNVAVALRTMTNQQPDILTPRLHCDKLKFKPIRSKFHPPDVSRFPNVFAAARQGFAPAMMMLALEYDNALTRADVRLILAQTSGGPTSESECRIEGYKWASVAENQGIESMKDALRGFKKAMTREELAEAKQRAKASLKEFARARAKQSSRPSAWEK
jgi:hypothetical protein